MFILTDYYTQEYYGLQSSADGNYGINILDEREMEIEWIEQGHCDPQMIWGLHYPIPISSPKHIYLHSVFFLWRHKPQTLLWNFSFTMGVWWCTATLCWNRHGPSNFSTSPMFVLKEHCELHHIFFSGI